MRYRPCFLVAAALVAACGSAQAPAPADAGSGSAELGTPESAPTRAGPRPPMRAMAERTPGPEARGPVAAPPMRECRTPAEAAAGPTNALGSAGGPGAAAARHSDARHAG